jgi:hypothetical protein
VLFVVMITYAEMTICVIFINHFRVGDH